MPFRVRFRERRKPAIPAASRAQRKAWNEKNWLDLLQKSIADFSQLCEQDVLRSVPARILLATVVITYCLGRAVVGLVGSRLYSHDAFWTLDGAWRMMNGQRPQADFSSLQGFLAYVPNVVGLWISNGTIWGYGYGQALMGLCLTVWMYFIGRHRLSAVPLAVACLAVCFTATAPFCPGTSPLQLSPGVTYNRYGYCFLALILVEAVETARYSIARGEMAGGLSTGAIVAALAFFKITYFFAALFLVVFLYFCKTQTKIRWRAIGIGFGVVLILCLSYYSFRAESILSDLSFIARARHTRIIPYQSDQMLGYAAILVSFTLAAAALARTQLAAKRIVFAGVVATICGVMIVYGNFEFSGFAMAPFIVILIADLLIRDASESSFSSNLQKGVLLVFGTAILSVVFFSAVFSMGFGFYARFFEAPTIPHMRGDRLSGFATAGDDLFYAAFVNDGIDLLERLRAPNETVMCLDFTNPFSYGLGIKPAPNGTIGWQYKYTFNDRVYLPPQYVFGRANLVVVPRIFSDGSLQESVPRIYGPYLMAHFHEIGRSETWTLYRRNS